MRPPAIAAGAAPAAPTAGGGGATMIAPQVSAGVSIPADVGAPSIITGGVAMPAPVVSVSAAATVPRIPVGSMGMLSPSVRGGSAPLMLGGQIITAYVGADRIESAHLGAIRLGE